jgi:hypothetical protein
VENDGKVALPRPAIAMRNTTTGFGRYISDLLPFNFAKRVQFATTHP